MLVLWTPEEFVDIVEKEGNGERQPGYVLRFCPVCFGARRRWPEEGTSPARKCSVALCGDGVVQSDSVFA